MNVKTYRAVEKFLTKKLTFPFEIVGPFEILGMRQEGKDIFVEIRTDDGEEELRIREEVLENEAGREVD